MKTQHHYLFGRFGSRVWLVASLWLAATTAQAQIAIEAVTGSLQGGSEVVKIDLSESLPAVPTGFSIQSPARIALDFPGVVSAMGRSSLDINQGNLKSVSVVQAGDRTRVVLNLKQYTAYKTQIQGKSLYVLLDAVADVASVEAPKVFAQTVVRDALPLRDLDFRRGADASGRIIVSLPSDQVGVDIRQQGQTLVVEFMKTSLPEGLRRRLDVTDFGTPVKTITTSQSGDRVRMVIEPQGDWVHSAYQSNSEFVVEVKPVKVDTSKLTQGPGYSGQKLSLNFQNIEVRSLLQVIADFTNFNVITSDSVNGAVTLRLQDVPWDQALDIILQAKGLGMRKTGNVLWIAPKDEINAKEKLDMESAAALQSLEPLRTQSYQLNYTKSEEVAKGLNGQSQGGGSAQASRILSTRGSVIFETRTNQLFVTDIPSKLEEIQVLISKIDIPVRQVMIEARIVEASDTFSKSLGVRLGGGSSSTNASIGSSYTSGSAGTTSGSFVNFPVAGGAAVAFSIFNSSATKFLNLEISALEADGKGKVISSPRVITADQIKALIEQGTEFPYQVASSSGATSIAFRKASLKLEVTPQITPEGGIILALDVTKDTRGISTDAGYAIDTKHIQTQVLVENGGTVVVGGIFTEDTSNTIDKVPLLGDLPGVGVLFKRTVNSTEKREMLVFITPRVLKDKVAR
ncbi:type IV pilus secretin PilQ [Rhodoferax sp. U11-2br]|uniref:type IV pilus secretin PilQ n=1 Tax=Rhodoferax sp. U11-2br TaxID=2838878 RepID=UPI001BE5F798|nr:type IV pilus secretin PilQ [Rhodoferax sp. U11-2br]MBT3069005.1 type IV pilus secretin PilQ family protein [Rhodoferax sp. U11-2br]